jgi:DNA-binding response OmpR family regulator
MTTLGYEGFVSSGASCAKEGFDTLHKNEVDLILLDLGLPDMSGLSFLQQLRKTSKVPVIVVSAIHDPFDKVKSLDAGADDYATKPFDTKELIARIYANLRRISYIETNEVFNI